MDGWINVKKQHQPAITETADWIQRWVWAWLASFTSVSCSNFSGWESGDKWQRFSRAGAPVTQPTVSKHWCQPVAWPHHFIHLLSWKKGHCSLYAGSPTGGSPSTVSVLSMTLPTAILCTGYKMTLMRMEGGATLHLSLAPVISHAEEATRLLQHARLFAISPKFSHVKPTLRSTVTFIANFWRRLPFLLFFGPKYMVCLGISGCRHMVYMEQPS